MPDILERGALVAYRAGSDAAGKGAMFVVMVAAARRLSQGDFGLFALASTGGWMLAVATDFGVQLHVARSIATRPADAAAIVRRWLRVRAGLASAGLIVVAAVVAGLRPGALDALAILLIAAAYLAGSLLEFLYYVYRGLGRSDLESTLVLVHRGTLVACALGALAWRPSLALLGAAMLVPAAGALAAAGRIAVRATKDVARAAEPPAAGREEPAPFRRGPGGGVVPIGVGIVLSALYFRIDLFLVAAWCGAPAAGLYNAVFRLVEALRLVPAAIVAVALPAIFRARTRRPLVELAAALTVLGVLAGGLGLAVAGWLVPLLYGASYAAAVPAFRILMLAFPLLSLNYALTHQLVGWHGERAWAVVCAAALLANIALDVRMIPALGIVGAAWATLSTEAVLALGCTLTLRSLVPRPAAVASAAAS